MPQHPRKTARMTITAGVKPPIYADNLYTVSGGVATLVGKTQYISKGVNGSWPTAGWHSGAEPSQNTQDIQVKTGGGKLPLDRDGDPNDMDDKPNSKLF